MDGDTPALVDRLARADEMLVAGTLRADDVHALLAEARAGDRPDLAALAAAILADHLILHGDPSAVLLAVTTLADLSQDPLAPPSVVLARARLRRVRIAATVFLDPSADVTAELHACLADYLRCGRHEDRWLTVALVHVVRVATAWTATTADRAAVVEARDQLVAAGSDRVPWARFAVALVADAVGDDDGVRSELATLRTHPSPGAPLHLTALLDAVRTLVEAPPGPRADEAVARLTDLADLVRRELPAASAGVTVVTAHALLDAGRATDAEEWLGRLGALPPAQAHEEAERAVMAVRLDLLQGRAASYGSRGPGDPDSPDSPDSPDDAVPAGAAAAFDTMASLGRPRMAGGLALRTAMSARAAGRDALADALLERARSLLPAELTDREAWWEQRAGGRVAAAGTHRLDLLTPSAVVVVAGRPVPLAPAHARLLAVLACLGRPASTESLVDVLWPDAEPDAARRRLKSAHHRLRLVLGPDADDLVRRERDVWSLVPGPAWSVDLMTFHRLAAGGTDDRLAALRLPSGLLWNAQLPFDEVLAELRGPVEARWLALARALLADGLVSAEEVARLAAPLGIETSDT